MCAEKTRGLDLDQVKNAAALLFGAGFVVCWNLAEKEDFVRLLYGWRSASVLLATFGLTLIEDLTVGIIAGCVLAAAFALADRVMRSRRTEA